MSASRTITGLLASLSDSYQRKNSLPEFDKSTLENISNHIDADLYLLASTGDGGVQTMASIPPDWTDPGALLTPVSAPVDAISKGKSRIIDDFSEVRSATADEPVQNSGKNGFRSVAVTPFDDDLMLLVASRTPSNFDELDLETLKIISSFASPLRSYMGSEETAYQERVMEDATAMLSHDAGNFLTIILGHLELARDEPKEQHFEAIERGGERLTELIEDTTTILRFGSKVDEYERVPLEGAARAAWDSSGPEEASLIQGEPGTILAHRGSLCELLETVFRHMVEHAEGEVTVTVGVLETSDGFYIQDDEPGVEPGEIDRIFDLGYSSGPDDEGLGLAIVRRIAEAHGWDISVQIGEQRGLRLEFHNVEVAE